MTELVPSGRPICKACDRPLDYCLCSFISVHSSRYRVVILQDPKEARHAMSTAPLLARSLQDSRLVVGEVFDPLPLLGERWRERTLLIFPGGEDRNSSDRSSQFIDTLLLLDGTWRKVRRLLHLNPWLNELPRFSLTASGKSRYRIRKSPRADGLATIEAAVAALNELEPDRCYDDMLLVFDKMVEMQLASMGPALAKSRYGDK